MGLKTRLLAGLAVLVFAAIASTGWLTLQAARVRLDSVEEERARGLGVAAAGVMAAASGPAGAREPRAVASLAAAERSLAAGGGVEVRFVDETLRAVTGSPTAAPESDPLLVAVMGGGGPIVRRAPDAILVYAPAERASGGVVGAVRVRVAVDPALGEAVRGGNRLLLFLTLVDGGLVLLFGALFLRLVIRPIDQLAVAASSVAAGDLDGPEVEAGVGELGSLTRAFNGMTAALRDQKLRLAASQEQLLSQEKLATVGRLAAGVAHEVGNPLTAILGYVEILLADEKDAAARDLLERVRAETSRIHHIVHELLDYARPERPASEPVDVRAAVQAAVGLLHPQPRFRDVRVEDCLGASPARVAASTGRLVQVLVNLLLNAADAMGGRGVVTVEAEAATLGGGQAALAIDVLDEGPGVPEAIRSRVFNPFFSTKEPGAGTGLGLAVCRSIARAHGGDVTLLPSPRGARFRVTLPLFDDAAELAAPRP